MRPVGRQFSAGPGLIRTIADTGGMRVPDVGAAAKASERLDVTTRAIRAEIAVLAALDAAVLVGTDHVAVIFVKEDSVLFIPPINSPKAEAEVVQGLIPHHNARVRFFIQLKPDACIDRIEASVLFFKPSAKVAMMIASDDYVCAPRSCRHIDKLTRCTQLG